MKRAIPEHRRYRAEMPPAALRPGRAPRLRRRRRDAFADLADGLDRYLRSEAPPGAREAWTAWALRLAAGLQPGPAPDGSEWLVRTCIDVL